MLVCHKWIQKAFSGSDEIYILYWCHGQVVGLCTSILRYSLKEISPMPVSQLVWFTETKDLLLEYYSTDKAVIMLTVTPQQDRDGHR